MIDHRHALADLFPAKPGRTPRQRPTPPKSAPKRRSPRADGVIKDWAPSPIPVDGWRPRFAATARTGYCPSAPTIGEAIAKALDKAHGGDEIISVAKYETRVVGDAPTGLYFRFHVPTLDPEDADISRNLVVI